MFHKVHIKLTVLFTAVSSIILIGMSLMFLFFQTKNLYQNEDNKFKQDVNGFLFTFENNPVVSYNYLDSIQNNYQYDFYIYDNGVPMRFMKDTKSREQLNFIEKLKKEKPVSENTQKNNSAAYHTEFKYKTENEEFNVSLITLYGKKGDTEIYAVSSLKGIKNQLKALYLKFTAVVLTGIILIFIFSWYYTKKLLKPIKKSQEAQNHFITAASHEIRNPVNTMLSALEASQHSEDEQQKEFLNIAKKEGSRLIRLTNELLTLTLSGSKNIAMNFTETELDTILIDCYEAFLQPAGKKRISLSISLPEEPLVSDHMDGEKIKQTVSILLDNAVSYTPEGGKINLKCEKSKKDFVITVSDNGVGLTAEEKDHIFQRFYRADQSRHSKEHFGLGLSIAQEIISLHKGKIDVSDIPEGGTAFIVRIPI